MRYKQALFGILCSLLCTSHAFAQDSVPTTDENAPQEGVEAFDSGNPMKAEDIHTTAPLQTLPGAEALKAALEKIPETNEIKPGQPMTLKQALEAVDKQNITLEKARLSITKAEAQLQQAWAMVMPNISGSLSWTHMNKGMTANVMGISVTMQPQDSVSAGLTIGANLINAASWFQLRMIDESVEATKLGIEQARQSLLAGAAQAYLSALLTGELVRIQHELLSNAIDNLEVAQKRFDAGVGVRLDVIQAQFNVENYRQSLIDAIWSYEKARDALGTLTNVGGLPVPQPTKLPPIGDFSEEKLVEEAIQQNYTLQISRVTAEINKLDLDATLAGFAPSLSGGWQASYSLTEPAGLGSADRLNWALALSVSIPIFDYSKFAAVQEKKAAIEETRLGYEDEENSTKQKVRSAIRDYYSAIFAVDNATRQVALAHEALALTEATYRNGAATIFDLTSAQRTVNNAEIAYITSQIQAQLSLISLNSTLGRDIMELAK